MRGGEQTRLLQILHDIADRRGRQVHAAYFRQSPRTDRRPRFQIAFDHDTENRAGAVVQFGDGCLAHAPDVAQRACKASEASYGEHNHILGKI